MLQNNQSPTLVATGSRKKICTLDPRPSGRRRGSGQFQVVGELGGEEKWAGPSGFTRACASPSIRRDTRARQSLARRRRRRAAGRTEHTTTLEYLESKEGSDGDNDIIRNASF